MRLARPSRPHLRRLAALSGLTLLLATIWQPPVVQRAGHWIGYRLTGHLPPPLLAGRNGRVFLANHPTDPPGSLLAQVCGAGLDAAAIGRAADALRPVLAAGKATGLPFRLLVVPTAARLYPEDLPEGMGCAHPAADQVVAALHDDALVYPAAAMEAMKPRFDVLPRHHFHWAGEGPLRVAELVADGIGLPRTLTLPLRPDNRASDLRGFYAGAGLEDRIGTPFLKAAGVTQCAGAGCRPPVPDDVVAYHRSGPGRILVIGDSFADEVAGDFAEYAGTVWLVRMNLAMARPPDLSALRPDAIVAVYHDFGAMGLDAASQASLAATARLLGELGLPAALAPR